MEGSRAGSRVRQSMLEATAWGGAVEGERALRLELCHGVRCGASPFSPSVERRVVRDCSWLGRRMGLGLELSPDQMAVYKSKGAGAEKASNNGIPNRYLPLESSLHCSSSSSSLPSLYPDFLPPGLLDPSSTFLY